MSLLGGGPTATAVLPARRALSRRGLVLLTLVVMVAPTTVRQRRSAYSVPVAAQRKQESQNQRQRRVAGDGGRDRKGGVVKTNRILWERWLSWLDEVTPRMHMVSSHTRHFIYRQRVKSIKG